MRGVQLVAIYNLTRCYQLGQYQSPHQTLSRKAKHFISQKHLSLNLVKVT